jgi:hypothetical protein
MGSTRFMLKARFLSILLTVFLSLKHSTSVAQTTLTWKDFDRITYVEKTDSIYQDVSELPIFTEKLKKAETSEVLIKGYLFLIDISTNYYILKKDNKPIQFGCFSSQNKINDFVRVEFKDIEIPNLNQFTNKEVTIKGILELNDSDILSMPINIDSAEIVQ